MKQRQTTRAHAYRASECPESEQTALLKKMPANKSPIRKVEGQDPKMPVSEKPLLENAELFQTTLVSVALPSTSSPRSAICPCIPDFVKQKIRKSSIKGDSIKYSYSQLPCVHPTKQHTLEFYELSINLNRVMRLLHIVAGADLYPYMHALAHAGNASSD
jgi:hypothetical protein